MNWASSSSLKASKLPQFFISDLKPFPAPAQMAEDASPTHHLTFIFIVIMILIALVSANSTSPALLLHSLPVPAMVLPLYHSTPNSPPPPFSAFNSCRHLQGSDSSPHRPNARMSLYDDLLRNGYYTTRLLIGTPPQVFHLIVDTGSTVTYVPCASCEQCGKHQDPKFDPQASSTYQALKCNINCSCDNERVNCIYERQYAEMSTSSGVLGEDFISFGNRSDLNPQKAVFGCENMETGDLFSQPADGIMGLGRGDLSVVDQLVEKGVISDSFSLCYGGMDIGGGAMVLGGISAPKEMVFTQSNPGRSPYYNIDLKGINVAGKQLALDSGVFDGKHGTVLDSGTTYAYLPEAAFTAFKEALMKELSSLRQIPGPDPNYNDVCFSTDGSDASQLSSTFPQVDMIFGNGQKFGLSPENYLFRHSKIQGAYCLGIFQNGKDPTTLLGGILVRNTLVTYDRERSKIGFWKTNCSELWERLHVTPSPLPTSPTSEDKNPTAAPSGLPYVLPGDLQIGHVTFDMSLNITYSNLKPHITELGEFIAQGLDIKTSQVNLLKFFGSENQSLIKWDITPADSTDYFSNTTAVAIVSRLAEHQLQFPVMFGSYQLIGWTVEPKAKRTWGKSHVVIISILVVLVIGILVSGLWLFWRHRQRTVNPYEPVDATVTEAELQPL